MSEAELTATVISVLANFGMACAATAGAIAAFIGLDRWKAQRQWEKRTELCEELLLLFQQRRDAVYDTRQSAFIPPRVRHDEDGNTVTDREVAEHLGLISHYEQRLGRLDEVNRQLYVKILRAKIVLDSDFSDLLTALKAHEAKLVIAIRRYLGSINPNNNHPRVPPFNDEHFDILFDSTADDDSFRINYDRDYMKIENVLWAKLRALYQ